MLEDRTIVTVKISEIVKGGAVAYLEGIRAFIPASKLAAEYVEDLEEWNGKSIEVTVITADEEEKRLVLSGKEVAREKLAAETRKKVSKCQVGEVVSGTVETLKDYGAFVELENGLTGLLHISQINVYHVTVQCHLSDVSTGICHSGFAHTLTNQIPFFGSDTGIYHSALP